LCPLPTNKNKKRKYLEGERIDERGEKYDKEKKRKR